RDLALCALNARTPPPTPGVRMTRPARESGALVAVTGTIAAALVPALAFVLWGALPAAQADPSEEPAPAHAYQAAGPDVSGASSQAQAPLLVPGIHLDSFARGRPEPGGGHRHREVLPHPGQHRPEGARR